MAIARHIGQPAAGVLSSDNYTLDGSFWKDVLVIRSIYLPIVLR